jgi:hypothetical protein
LRRFGDDTAKAVLPREEVTMHKSIIMSGTAVAVAAAWALLQVGNYQAAAQSG